MNQTSSPAKARLVVLTGERREIDLDPARRYILGRADSADVGVASDLISRNHAALEASPNGWRIVDLESTNGTAIDDEPLPAGGSRELEPGSEISLGEGAARFLFELSHPKTRPPGEVMVVRPGDRKPQAKIEKGMVARDALHLSDVLPFLSRDKSVLQRSLILPGVITVAVMIELFRLNGATRLAVAHNSIPTYLAETTKFIEVLAAFVTAALAYAVVAVSGRRQPWWAYGAVVTVETILLLVLIGPIEAPFHALAAHFGNDDTPFGLASILFFITGVGLPEELLKTIPLALLMLFAAKRTARDPLDGAGLACIAAGTFVFIETVFQYVPNEITHFVDVLGNNGIGLGVASGLELLIARLLGAIAGHMAWSGYLGYTVVLAWQRRSWPLFVMGWGVVAVLHGVWDAINGMPEGNLQYFLLFVVAVLSFVLLFAAIRRSRRSLGLSTPLHAVQTP